MRNPRPRVGPLVLAALAACSAGPASAQSGWPAPTLRDPGFAAADPAWPPTPEFLLGDAAPAAALLASAMLPGSGQALLGEPRWFAFVAAEAWGWLSYVDRRGDARDLERRYKDLAWSIARRVSVGARRDTVFEYYEALSHFDASGAFDTDPTIPGIQPETDPETFNGDTWRLARSLFVPGGGNFPPGSVEYERALDYYVSRAIPSAYAWSWGGGRLEQQRFSDLIHESDEAFRDATFIIGGIIANHIISALDALITARMRRAGGESLRIRNQFSEPWNPVWRITVTVPW